MGELGIHSGAGRRERLQGRRRFDQTIHQHASGGVRSFTAGFAALDDENPGAALAKGDGQRQADDAAADDDDVPGLHEVIVEETERGAGRLTSADSLAGLGNGGRLPDNR